MVWCTFPKHTLLISWHNLWYGILHVQAHQLRNNTALHRSVVTRVMGVISCLADPPHFCLNLCCDSPPVLSVHTVSSSGEQWRGLQDQTAHFSLFSVCIIPFRSWLQDKGFANSIHRDKNQAVPDHSPRCCRMFIIWVIYAAKRYITACANRKDSDHPARHACNVIIVCFSCILAILEMKTKASKRLCSCTGWSECLS